MCWLVYFNYMYVFDHCKLYLYDVYINDVIRFVFTVKHTTRDSAVT